MDLKLNGKLYWREWRDLSVYAVLEAVGCGCCCRIHLSRQKYVFRSVLFAACGAAKSNKSENCTIMTGNMITKILSQSTLCLYLSDSLFAWYLDDILFSLKWRCSVVLASQFTILTYLLKISFTWGNCDFSRFPPAKICCLLCYVSSTITQQ